MKTLIAAVLLFGAAFGATYLVMFRAAPSAEEAAILESAKDAIVAELGERPERLRPTTHSVADYYDAYQASFAALNESCSEAARKAYAVAFVELVERAKRADRRSEPMNVPANGYDIILQFSDAAARNVIRNEDIPSRAFRRMFKDAGSVRERDGLIRDTDGKPIDVVRCEPLSAKG